MEFDLLISLCSFGHSPMFRTLLSVGPIEMQFDEIFLRFCVILTFCTSNIYSPNLDFLNQLISPF